MRHTHFMLLLKWSRWFWNSNAKAIVTRHEDTQNPNFAFLRRASDDVPIANLESSLDCSQECREWQKIKSRFAVAISWRPNSLICFCSQSGDRWQQLDLFMTSSEIVWLMELPALLHPSTSITRSVATTTRHGHFHALQRLAGAYSSCSFSGACSYSYPSFHFPVSILKNNK